MKSSNGYWQRQFHLLSSLGIFYLIVLAMFAIPLLGTFVVILIKGALDLRYLILALGCLGLAGLAFLVYKIARRVWYRMRRDGQMAGEAMRHDLLLGKPVEISIFNGMLKFSLGKEDSHALPALPHAKPALLPQETCGDAAGDLLDRLQHLTKLKESGAIDADEFNLLKTMLIESSSSTWASGERERS